MRLSNSNLELLRQRPQQTKLYLSIFQPTAIFKALINDPTIQSGARVITFDTVSLGDSTLVQNGMTLWIGNTNGGQEIGKVRVKSITPTAITVSENDDIAWGDNQYLTVYKYWELWPVFPRIIIDPNDDENVLFYKDYDIPYTNQNSILGTYVNAGPHRAAWLDPASGQVQLWYSSTGSYNLVGTSLAYDWKFEGGTPSTSTAADPGLVTYNTPGHYVTSLSISGSNGCVDTRYIYASIYNQANPPIQKWQLNGFQGSRDEGGYTASLKVYQIIPIQEHAVVVLFAENWYGNTKQSLGGNYPNSSDIFFVGYVDKDSIEYDYEHSEVSFDALSLTGIMKKTSGFSVSVKSVPDPTKWYELLDMDTRRALYHYLKWHTTALSLSDFAFVGDDYKRQYFDSDRESMFDAIDNDMQNSLIGKTVSDRQGKVWLEVEAMAYSNPTGTFTPPIMDIINRDWMNTPTVEERLTNAVSYLEYGGVAYSGVVTGTFNAYIGSAPGNAPGFYGGIESHQGLVLLGQDQINYLVGNVFANKNSEFPNISTELGINVTNIDIAPQETLGLHLLRTDTVRDKAIDGLYIPKFMSWKYDPDNFIMIPQLDSAELVSGKIGQTVTIPPIADIGGGFTSDIDLFPPNPDIFSPSLPTTGDTAPARVLVHDPVAGLIFTHTFNTPFPGWYQVNGGLTTTQFQTINKVLVCPNGSIYAAGLSLSDGAAISQFLAYAPAVGLPFEIIEDQDSIDAKTGASAGNGKLLDVACNPLDGTVAYVLNDGGLGGFTFIGTETTFTAGALVSISNVNATLSFGGGGWRLTGGNFSGGAVAIGYVFAPDMSAITFTSALLFFLASRHKWFGTSASTLHYLATDNGVYLATDNFADFSASIGTNVLGDINDVTEDAMAVSVSGQEIMARSAANGHCKSSDGGYSWTDIPSLPVFAPWCFAYCGGAINDSQWIAATSYILYSQNFGTSWVTKQGNLIDINPLYVLNIVKVIP